MKTTPKVRTLAATLITIGSLAGGANAATITNDGYPPLGGVSWSPSGPGLGKVGGMTWSYSSLDFSYYDQLWFGFNTSALPKISMNSAPGFTAGENLTFSSGDSSLATGVAVWIGSSDFSHSAPTIVTSNIPVRLTLTLSGVGATDFVESGSLLTIDPAFDTSQSALAEITGDFSMNFLAEGFKDGTWTPINDLFESESTINGDGTKSSFGTSFYSSAVPEPSSTALLGLGGLALMLRRRR